VHAKNVEAINWLMRHKYAGGELRFFWHQNDTFTLTSNGRLWCYPSKAVFQNGINLMPELNGLTKEDLYNVEGVCTDYPSMYL
jgi:hypothetical protein